MRGNDIEIKVDTANLEAATERLAELAGAVDKLIQRAEHLEPFMAKAEDVVPGDIVASHGRVIHVAKSYFCARHCMWVIEDGTGTNMRPDTGETRVRLVGRASERDRKMAETTRQGLAELDASRGRVVL